MLLEVYVSRMPNSIGRGNLYKRRTEAVEASSRPHCDSSNRKTPGEETKSGDAILMTDIGLDYRRMSDVFEEFGNGIFVWFAKN